MSVGDIKGCRRKQRDRVRKGLAPRPRGHTAAESIAREAEKARREAMRKAKGK